MSKVTGKNVQRPARRKADYVRSVAQVIAAANSLAPGPDFDWFAPNPEAKAAVHIKDGSYAPDLSAKSAFLGGCIEDGKSSSVRVEAGDGKTGGVFVQGKGSWELDGAWISLSGDCDGIGGPATGAAVCDGGELVIRDAVISASGLTHYATVAERGSVLKVYNSTLSSHGAPFANGEPQPNKPMQTPPPPLMIAGNSRTHCTMTNSESYFYNSTIVGDGWAALSTEAAEGYVLIEANDCTVVTVRRGYAAYVDPGCHVRLNRCKIDSADMSAIIGGEGEYTQVDCDVRCGANFLLMHSVFGEPEEVSEVTIRGGKIRSVGDSMLVKSRNIELVLDNTDIKAETGVLIRSIHNEDFLATPVGEDPYGVSVLLKDMTATGDIIHSDNEREMWLKVQNATVNGAIVGAHLEMDAASRWYATGNSEVTLMGTVDVAQIDAPAGVTVVAHAGDKGTFALASGGTLELVD
ncbi:MAG: hypothetical protein IKV99_04355 [Oscillospiraceae bacterium]|nr:hypothetical protein [Oscillospiraceae bacterium]